MSIKQTPHKPEAQTEADRDWATGSWCPNRCKICEQNLNHPVHWIKYRDNPTKYKLDREQKRIGKSENGRW